MSQVDRDVPFYNEEGGGWIVTDDRRRAARIVRDFDYENDMLPLSSYTVRRCYLRPAVEGDWVFEEYGEGGAMTCDKDHPDAVPAWSVCRDPA